MLDIRDNDGVTELPPELVRDTPLQNLMVGLGLGFGFGLGLGLGPNPNPNPDPNQVGPALVGSDGQLVEMEGRGSTLRRPHQQCPASARAPPQGAAGGSGPLRAPSGEAGP